jgi:hypothetical protein
MAAGGRWNSFGWFPVLLAADIGMLLPNRNVALGATSSEVHLNATSVLEVHLRAINCSMESWRELSAPKCFRMRML